MNLYHLRYFVTLAGIQHYTKAAEMLSIAQPSLSHAIALMEDELGVPLFAKNGRNVVLTHYGEEFLEYAQQALNALDAGVEALKRKSGSGAAIRLGFCAPMGIQFVPKMTAGFLKNQPGAQFSFCESDAEKLLAGLNAGEYDAVFCEMPASKPDLEIYPVHRASWVLAVGKKHPLARKSEITVSEIAREKLILPPKGTDARKMAEQLLEGEKMQIACETESQSVIAGLVAQGLGVCILLRESVEDNPNIVCIPIADAECETEFSMICAKKKFMSPIAQKFCRYVRNQAVQENKKPDASAG